MWTARQIPDLQGKVAVVTGGNSGIGFATVQELARHGAKVHMAARSESRAKAAIKRLKDTNPSIPNENIVWLPLDLSSISSVVDAARKLLAEEQRLDILVNNAGTAADSFETSKDGFELTMAVNHVGHWVFTYHLLPLLKKTAAQKGSDVRVVTVSSSAESFAPSTNALSSIQDLKDPCSKPGSHKTLPALFRRYGLSKLANILFAAELQRRMDSEGVPLTSISLNPGAVSTDGAANIWPAFLRPIFRLVSTTPEKGALTSLFAAVAVDVTKDRDKYKGKYMDGPGNVKTPSARAQDANLARRLWDTTEDAVQKLGYL